MVKEAERSKLRGGTIAFSVVFSLTVLRVAEKLLVLTMRAYRHDLVVTLIVLSIVLYGCSSQNESPQSTQGLTPAPVATPYKIVPVWPKNVRQRIIYQLPGGSGDGYPRPAAFSHDGRLFASLAPGEQSRDTVYLWDTHTGKLISSYTIPNITEFALSPDSHTIVVITGQRGRYGIKKPFSVQLRDRRSGSLLRTYLKAGAIPAGLYRITFSPNGRLVAAGCGDGNVRVWSVKTGRRVAMLRPGGWFEALAFSPNSRYIGGLSGGGITLWDVNSSNQQPVTASATGEIGSLTFSPNGRLLIVSNHRKSIQVYKMPKLEKIQQLDSSGDERDYINETTAQVAVSADSHRIAFTRNWNITVRDIASLQHAIVNYEIDSAGVLALHFGPSGRELIWVTYGNDIVDPYRLTYRLKLWHATGIR